MALKVEVAGFGICHTTQPYSVFIVCVQQEKFEAWTVYRRYVSFNLLRDQLLSLHPGIPAIPYFNTEDLDLDNLESCRVVLDKWLQVVTSNSYILRMQSMYQFLCLDANMPPPYLELHWRSSSNGSFDEMEMDDLFDKHHEEGEEVMDEDEDADENEMRGIATDHVFHHTEAHRSKSSPHHGKGNKRRASGTRQKSRDEYDQTDKDGIDIVSLSVNMEAEYIYDKADEGKQQTPNKTKRTINLETFKIIKVIGKGSFGKVFLVRDKASDILYAMKVLKKDYIIRKNQVEHTKTERSVLGMVRHPYIVGLNMAFQTADKLFFVLDYCAGGELFFHLGNVGRFSEERSRFYAAQIVLALEYVHKLGIIYRDLKPENVLLDAKGNIRLTDFGLSKEGVSDHSSGANSFCGTPEYIAPEVLLRQGHGFAVDWWSLGALLYEMISGLPPFYSRNRETMFEKIMKAELTFPPQISEIAKDLLSRLLVRDPKQRLGSGETDAEEIKRHAFFQDVNWTELNSGKLPPPWTPSVAGSLDTSQFDQEFTSMMPIVSPDVRDAYFGSLDKAFEGFTFVDDSAAVHMGGASHGNRGRTASKSATAATLLSMKKR